jgi:protein gp37
MKDSKIEWCHHTVNFWWGCSFARYLDGSVREECEHCYALLLSKLFSRGRATWGPNGNRWIRHEKAVAELQKLDRDAGKRGVRERVFVNSMSDTFEDRDDLNAARSALWNAVPHLLHLDILLLTKRPQNVNRMVPQAWLLSWPAHVWIGTTCGTQKAADENIPHLLRIPARVRFLSCEPMVGPVNIYDMANAPLGCPWEDAKIHWVICGGESGPGARPMHPDWARSLRDQCQAAGVAFFFKQWGEWCPGVARLKPYNHAKPEEYVNEVRWVSTGKTVGITERTQQRNLTTPEREPHRFEDGEILTYRIGKEEAGRLLDGREWNEMPGGAP